MTFKKIIDRLQKKKKKIIDHLEDAIQIVEQVEAVNQINYDAQKGGRNRAKSEKYINYQLSATFLLIFSYASSEHFNIIKVLLLEKVVQFLKDVFLIWINK